MKYRVYILLLCFSLVIGILSGCTSEPAHTSGADLPDPVEPITSETEIPTEETAEQTEEPAPSTEVPETEAVTEPAAEPESEETVISDFRFELSENSIVLTQKGQKQLLYCGDVPLNEISWFSADDAIALFSQGTVVAIDRGTTVVYAKYRDEIIFCEVICDVDPDAPAPYVDNNLLQAPKLGVPYVEDPMDTSFFDDAVFIGDSVSYVLQQWNLKNNNFGKAVFLARSSLGLQNTIDGRMKLNYQGVSYSPEDAVAAVGANKLFIMLGYNDIALFGLEGTMERWEIFLDRIVEKNPGIQIYIQSCTPIHTDAEYSKLNNDILDTYNLTLEGFCLERGYHFVNIAPYFKDHRNSLAPIYCSDKSMHITYDGAVVWEYALKAYAAQQQIKEGE